MSPSVFNSNTFFISTSSSLLAICPNHLKVDKVLQKEDIKILWDFKIQTDKHLAHNIPDITVVEKKRVWIIDMAIPGDGRIEEKKL